MSRKRKIFYAVVYALLGAVMAVLTVMLFLGMDWMVWVEKMTGAICWLLFAATDHMHRSEWVKQHPNGARIEKVCLGLWMGMIVIHLCMLFVL